eukprot:3460489-Rhodomonas_salina.6
MRRLVAIRYDIEKAIDLAKSPAYLPTRLPYPNPQEGWWSMKKRLPASKRASSRTVSRGAPAKEEGELGSGSNFTETDSAAWQAFAHRPTGSE